MIPEHLHIILFSIPIYQLFYFTTQVIIAKYYRAQRVLGGLFLLLITLMAVANAFIFYQSPRQYLYEGIFYTLFVTAAATLFFYTHCVENQGKKVVQADVLKHYLFPAIYIFVWLGIFFIPNEVQHVNFMRTDAAGGSFLFSQKFFNLGFSGIAILYFIGKFFANFSSIVSITKRRIKAPDSYPLWEKEKMHLPALYLLTFIVLTAMLLFHIPGLRNDHSLLIAYNLILLLPGGLLGHQLTTLLNNTQTGYTPETRKEATKLNLLDPSEPSFESKLTYETACEAITPLISSEEEENLLKKLQKVMEEIKPFTNPRFSLDDLCLLLDINKRKARYLINHVMNNNFYGLVNEYRVEESIRLLQSDEHKKFTIETIALMAGFQSKSSYYAAFKKYKNITPGEYKEIKEL